MARYTMPQELHSETKLGKYIFFIDAAVIGGYYLFFSIFEDYVHPTLTTVYTVFNVLVAFLLTRPSRANPQRRIYQSLLIGLITDQNVYHVKQEGAQQE